jgi:hypothetical protein
MGRDIKDQKRDSGLNMITVIIDYELEDYLCTKFLDEGQLKEWLSYDENEIYFVNISDKTWIRFKTKNSKRLELKLDELMKLIHKSSWLILTKENRAEACMYYPKDDDPQPEINHDKHIF